MTNRDTRRAFTITQRNEILYQQDNKCAICHKKLDPRLIEYDHIKPWAAQGRTITQNGAALCRDCHGVKTHKERLKKINNMKIDKTPVSETSLKKLNIKQLKFLATRLKIKVTGKLVGDMWETHRAAPTKTQYIAKLKGVVKANDLRIIPKESPKTVKKKIKKSNNSLW